MQQDPFNPEYLYRQQLSNQKSSSRKPRSTRRPSRAGTKNTTHSIPVHNDTSSPAQHSSFDTYNVSSRFLPREVVKRVAPKRPLGVPPRMASTATPRRRQPVKMYSQIAAMSASGRVRRSRMTIPVEVIESDDVDRTNHFSAFLQKTFQRLKELIVAAALFIAAKAASARNHIADRVQAVPFMRPKVRYSAARGANKKFIGIPIGWLKYLVLTAALLAVIGLGLYSAYYNNGSGNGSGGTSPGRDNNGGAGSGNPAVIPGQKNNSQTDEEIQQNTQSGSGSPQSQGTGTLTPGGRINGSGGSGPVVGGRGGGSGTTSTPPASGSTSSPTVTTGDNTVGEAVPTPGITDPQIEGSPSTPLPITTTVPPTNVSSDDKTIIDSSGTTFTIN